MTVPVPSSEPKKSSPWLWVGLGCGGVLLVCMVIAAVGVFFLYGRMKNFEKQFSDPAVREARVRELMGASEIPEGYHAFMTFSIPWVMDMAILSDRDFVQKPPSGSSPFERRGFIYVHVPMKKAGGKKWQEFLEGKRNPDEFLQSNEIRFRQHETIGRGVIHAEDGTNYHYVAARGEVNIGRETKEGITTLIGVECPNDEKLRLGIWLGPDPTGGSTETPAAPEEPSRGEAEEKNQGDDGGASAEPGAAPSPDVAPQPGEVGPAPAVYAGTVADEAAIKDFMSHFSLCQ